MQSWQNQLSEIEKRIQVIIEGGAARLFAAPDPRGNLSAQMVASLEKSCKRLPDGRLAVANHLLFAVNPQHAGRLRQEKQLLFKLEQELEKCSSQRDWIFQNPPVIQIVEDEDILDNRVVVSCKFTQDEIEPTADLLAESPMEQAGVIPENAFLIVNGVDIFNLEQSVINIGRHPDNHLTLEDPRISRQHAQIRAIDGRFFLFDLESRGGTFVNQQPAQECMLHPGDVISLAGVPLVYGEDTIGSGQTEKIDLS